MAMKKSEMTEWLKLGEVLGKLRVNQNTIDRWIRNGTFPKPHYFGLTRRWSTQEVEDWCQNTPTDSRDVPHNATAARAARASKARKAKERADAAA